MELKKNTDSYQKSIGKLFLDENTRFPIGILDDFVINSKDLKIEGFLIKNSFFRDSKVIKTSDVYRWSEDLFVSENSVKDLGFYESIKRILMNGNSVIWKKVVDEVGNSVGRVSDLIFSTSSFVGLSIVVRKSFFGLFFFGKERIVSRKNILDIGEDVVVIRNEEVVAV